LKLKSKDFVVYGARIKLEVTNQLKIKVFGREITITNPSGERARYCDIPLSEEEIAYVYLAERFKFSILPTGSSKVFLR